MPDLGSDGADHMRRIVLALAALEICGVGLVYLAAPATMLAMNGMALAGVNEAHATRAAYGGLFVAFGALFALGAVDARMTRPSLVALATFMVGFAVGRIVSLVADGWPTPAFLGALASEIVFGGLAVAMLIRADTAGARA